MEAPGYQAQSFSVDTVYEFLNSLTFSFLGTQFIKPNPRWKHVRSADSLLCGRKGPERPCLWTQGPCPLPDFSLVTNFMMSKQDPPTIRLGSWLVLGGALPKPLASVVYKSTVVYSTSYNGQISSCQNNPPEDNNHKLWRKHIKQQVKALMINPKKTYSVSGETVCQRP